MTGVYSILGFVAHLKAVEHDLNTLGPAIVARACEMVCEEAKRVIGEGYDFWPALKPETLARKMMNTPLLKPGSCGPLSNGSRTVSRAPSAQITTRRSGMNSGRRGSRRARS